MILKKLILKNYRKFDEKEVMFGPGINVIIGDNEAGKSTITMALMDVLYTDPTTQSKAVLGRIKSWNVEENPIIELIFEYNDNEFSLIKDFAKKEARLKNLDSGKSVFNMQDINSTVAEILGLATKEVYMNTAFISHDDIAKIAMTDKNFLNALQNIATESQEDVSLQGILAQINEELRKLRVGLDRPANNPGPLRMLRNRKSVLEREISEKKDVVNKVAESAQQSTKADAELAEVNERIKMLEQLRENYSVFEKANADLERLELQINQTEKILVSYDDLQSKKDRILAEMDTYQQFKKYDSEKAAQELNRLLEARKIANDEINRISIDEPKEEYTSGKHQFLKILIFIIALGISAGAYFLIHDFLITAVIAAFLLVIAVVITSLIGKSNRDAITLQKNQIKQNYNQWKFKIQSSTEGIKKILDDFRVEDSSGFFTAKARFNILNENLKQINSQIEGLLLNTSINQIKQQQINLLKSKREIEVNILTDEVRKTKISPQDYLASSRELDKLREKQKNLQTTLTTAKVRVADSEADSDYITRLEEELESVCSNLRFYERKDQVYQLTYDGIKEALKSTAQTSSKIIETEIEKDLKNLTSKRYERVKVGDDFSIQVFSKEKNSWINPIGNLSSGTIDQIYLLTRLGFLKAITHGKGIPIICDDPFVTFDENRRAELMKIMKGLSEAYQVVLLTLGADYVEWGRVNRV